MSIQSKHNNFRLRRHYDGTKRSHCRQTSLTGNATEISQQ